MSLWRRHFDQAIEDCPLFIDGGICVQTETFELSPHAHPGYELHVVESGRLLVHLDQGQRLEAAGGDLMITSPGVRHWGDHHVIPPSKLLWVVLGPLHPQDVAGSCLLPADMTNVERTFRQVGNTVISAPALLKRFRTLHRMLKERDRHTGDYHSAQIRAELCLIILDAVAALETSERKQPGTVTLAARQYLADHLSESISIPKLAAHLNLSPSRFHELFLTETGESPSACHMRLRMERAIELLRANDKLPIAQIAQGVGFADQRYFATCFKRLLGVTPSVFRGIQLRGTGDEKGPQ